MVSDLSESQKRFEGFEGEERRYDGKLAQFITSEQVFFGKIRIGNFHFLFHNYLP
jgi:hypothetical protein